MWQYRTAFILALAVLGVQCKLSEDELQKYISTTYEKEYVEHCKKSGLAAFAFATDVNNEEKQKASEATDVESATWTLDTWQKYFKGLKPEDFKDPKLKRMVKDLAIAGPSILGTEKVKELTGIINKLQTIYSTGKICPYDKQDCDLKTEGLNLEPGITNLFDKSRNYDELVYAWKQWRDATGAKMREPYKKYVELLNEAARLNNFSDNGAYWRYAFEDDKFVEHIDELWLQLEPLYSELLTYVGRKLKTFYGDKLNITDGLYPAHVFGNMWAQTWNSIEDIVTPYPGAQQLGTEVDATMKEKNYSVLDLMAISDKFYTNLGLPSNAVSYDESKGAMIEKPKDGREVLCHASAWDFCDGETYRLKMCTRVNLDDLITVHHEMGHINYDLLYKSQPAAFRGGANPGFHEAVGDTIALSVTSPKHLQKIGLLKNETISEETKINALMTNALEKVAFLPFGILIDKWRWDVFNQSVPESQWNEHWWALRRKYQKVKPPVERSENDFDPGAKYHVPGDSQYISYFVARVLQFQFLKAACIAAGEYGPGVAGKLHECDFDGSLAAGKIFRDGLSLGASQHWSETLKIMTGEDKLNAGPLLEYFEPLYEFLKKENAKI